MVSFVNKEPSYGRSREAKLVGANRPQVQRAPQVYQVNSPSRPSKP